MSEEDYRRVFGKSREEMLAQTRTELQEAIKNKQKDKAKELFDLMKRAFVGDDVFWANEVASNVFVGAVSVLLIVILIITIALTKVGIYTFDVTKLLPLSCLCIAQLLIGVILNTVFHGEKSWLKYVLMFVIMVTIAMAYGLTGYSAAICMVLPVVLSVKYLSEQFTRSVSVLGGIFLLSSTISSAYLEASMDLNTVAFKPGTVVTIETTLADALAGQEVVMQDFIRNLLLTSFLPNIFEYALICFVCCSIAKWGHRTVLEQRTAATEFARVDTELNMARDIQANVLPRIFPAFPDRKEFDIYASMDPAKEVGGDFYDFFMVDDNHLALVMADVSGKGVPAALFMMVGKAFIKTEAMTGESPAEVLTKVNNSLCEHNDLELFITAWLGILDLTTGHMVAANAGHEYPMIRRADGDYELFKDKHGVVLAAMEDFPYKQYELDLHPGDGLFVYTDGCTEATNAQNELFGTERLAEALRHNENEHPDTAIKKVRKEIDDFVGDAPQFDDITMLELIFYGK